jgi:outer membrane protein
MRHTMTLIFLFFAIFFLNTFSFCEAQNSVPLSLPEAVSKALGNNPDIRAIQASAQTAQWNLKESRTQFLPKVSFAGQYLTSDDITRQLPDSNAAVVRADEHLWQGGRLAADIQRLRNLKQSAAADLAAKHLEIVLSVQESFFRAIADKEQLTQWAQAQDEYAHLLKLLSPRFTIGSFPEYDYVKLKLSLIGYEQAGRDAARALMHEQFVLGALMGSDPPEGLQDLPTFQAPLLLNLQQVTNGLAQRPDMQSVDYQLKAQNFALKRARCERMPDLRMEGDYGYSGYSPSDVSIGWGFLTAATIPIFDFGTIRTHIGQAEALQTQLQFQKEALRLKIRTELSDALAGIQSAWETLEATRGSIPLAEKAYASSLRRYRTSLAAMTELNDAHDLLIQSRLRLIQATADYRSAQAQLAASRGLMEEK